MSAPVDGQTLYHLERPPEGWSQQVAIEIDSAVNHLVNQHGWDHLHVWMGRDAWEAMGRFLHYNGFLPAEIPQEIGPPGTVTGLFKVSYNTEATNK